MYKQDLEQTLLGIDEEAELEIGPRDDRPSVILVGGCAFMLNDVTNRSVTHDIDVFEADRCLREIIARYPEVNGMAVAYCNQMPFNYEDRLIPLEIGAHFIRYFTPSLEDLAVMKLYAYRPNDIVDLQVEHLSIDLIGICSSGLYSMRERRWPRRLRSGAIKRWSAHTGNTKRRCSVESDL